MTTVYFGPRWDAPMLDDDMAPVQVETPDGEWCYVCSEPIADGDRGLLRAGATINGPVRLFVHTECDMLGVIGHMYGVCTCTGFDTSERPSALALLEVLNAQRAKRGQGPL